MNTAEKLGRLEVAVRGMRVSDEPFIYRSWLKGCRKCVRHADLPAAVYYSDVHDQIESLIFAPVVRVHMAVATYNDQEFYGFLCTERLAGETKVVHFAYTKKSDRRRGVMSTLAAAAGLDLRRPFFYTAHPPMATDMVRSMPHAVYRKDILGLAR